MTDFDPQEFHEALLHLPGGCKVTISHDDYVRYVSWSTLRGRGENRTSSRQADAALDARLCCIHTPHGTAFVESDRPKPTEEPSASVQKKKLDERPIEPFDAGHLIDAVIVKTEPLVELKGHTWSKAQEEEFNPTPVAADDLPCERIEYPLTRINPFTGRLVSYRTRKNTPFEEANPTPVAADDIPCEPIEAELVDEKPSASITKRQLDEKPVPPICDCGAAATGTTHANWCSTRRGA